MSNIGQLNEDDDKREPGMNNRMEMERIAKIAQDGIL